MVWRLWPESKIFVDNAFEDMARSYRDMLESGYLSSHRRLEMEIAEDAYDYGHEAILFNPEQDVSNTEIDEGREPER